MDLHDHKCQGSAGDELMVSAGDELRASAAAGTVIKSVNELPRNKMNGSKISKIIQTLRPKILIA